MASGDVVGAISGILPVGGSTAATHGSTLGTSTPVENIPHLIFDDTTDQFADFLCALEGYGAGGIDVELVWGGAAASGVVGWNAACRRLTDDAEDLDTTAHTYVYNEISPTAPSVIGEVSYDVVAFTDGADMDSVADGERFILRIKRNASVASDMTGDAYLYWPLIVIRET